MSSGTCEVGGRGLVIKKVGEGGGGHTVATTAVHHYLWC